MATRLPSRVCSVFAFVVLGACARQAPLEHPFPETEAEAAEPRGIVARARPEPRPSAGSVRTVSGPDVRLADHVPLWLPHVYAALHELDEGRAERHVRILWFGDSHSAADFWSGGVRETLQGRFGAGGPGLVLLGVRRYRHSLARLEHRGKWRVIPRSPSAVAPQREPVLGLGGLGGIAVSSDASVRLLPSAALSAEGVLRYELLFRLPGPTSAFRVRLGEGPELEVGPGVGEARPSGLSSILLEAVNAAELVVDHLSGEPELFGVIVERAAAGLVLDTLGINGARAATPLAWPARAWEAEVRARRPDLVVLAYGTNEVGDTAPMSNYEAQYAALLARLRSAAPEADCLLIGPTDRVGKDWRSEPRVAEIDGMQQKVASDLGCAFWSPLEAMGGAGSLRRWAFGNPRLARRDRVHLLASGYRRLADMLSEQLLSSYDACYPEP